ncbi:MAG TPA: MarR family transcriptional regulator [Acidimicrobiales bacterium]|nr:MarR family transcriptional regulator [Acidimicrobiales bacterium]
MPRRAGPTVESAIAGLARSFEVVLETQGLTIQKYRTLAYLAVEPTTTSELAYRLTVRPPVVTRLVDGLAERGLVERQVDERDRRRTTLAVTRAGRRALAEANAAIREPLDRVAAQLPEHERAIAEEGLILWSKAMFRYWRLTHPGALDAATPSQE